MAKRPLRSHDIDVGFFHRWYRILLPFAWVAGVMLLIVLPVVAGLFAVLKYRFHQEFTWLTIAIVAVAITGLVMVDVAWRVIRGRRYLIRRIFEDMSQQRTPNFSSYLVDISPRLRKKLRFFSQREVELRDAPYLILRNACHHGQVNFLPFIRRGQWFRDPLDRRQGSHLEIGKHGLLDALNDVAASKIARAMNVDVKPIYGEGAYFEDRVTNINKQKSILDDGGDLPLRYVQATPQKRFIDHSLDGRRGQHVLNDRPLDGELPKAKYIIICCLTNPIKDPVYVLPVSAITRQLRNIFSDHADDYLTTLLRPMTPVFGELKPGEPEGEIADDVLELYNLFHRPILSLHHDTYRGGFDPNRIDYAGMVDRVDARKAVSAFMRAIDGATNDEVKIKLRAGDVLIINNYYGMHRRIEIGYKSLRPPFLFAKRRRWLRVYYGFSRPDPAE